jgi:hypothetical protein
MPQATILAEPPNLCHRHLACGQRVAAVAAVPIDVKDFIVEPPLCRACLEDADSWLRLFGLRDVDQPDIRKEWRAGHIVPSLHLITLPIPRQN